MAMKCDEGCWQFKGLQMVKCRVVKVVKMKDCNLVQD